MAYKTTYLNCVFHHDIDEELRKQLAGGKLQGVNAQAASWHELRGIAVLEVGHLDIELNINALESEQKSIEEATPLLDYFICQRFGSDRNDWDSLGYADEWIGKDGEANVDWSAENWEELLFADMLSSLSLVPIETRATKNLKYLTDNYPIF